MAAVAAGMVGLIGAGIGGLATAYGARVGAQKTIEAARTQVDRQATAEHRHWVREQRRQAYSAVLEADLVLTMAIDGCTSDLYKGTALSEDAVSSMGRHIKNLATAVTRATLWGPDDLIDKARDLIGARGRAIGKTVAWSMAVASGNAEAVRAAVNGMTGAEDREATRAFVTAVRRTLAEAATQDHGPETAQ